jgi:hypothetical protein
VTGGLVAIGAGERVALLAHEGGEMEGVIEDERVGVLQLLLVDLKPGMILRKRREDGRVALLRAGNLK